MWFLLSSLLHRLQACLLRPAQTSLQEAHRPRRRPVSGPMIAAPGRSSSCLASYSSACDPVCRHPAGRLVAEGRRIGFPLLVKAVLGGGGKGMKLARAAHELEARRAISRRIL